jgi:hypothetical protein
MAARRSSIVVIISAQVTGGRIAGMRCMYTTH